MNWPLVALLLAQLSLPAHNETMEVVVANVDVTVLDKDGTHVTGLLPDDFEILDNGVPQRITNFSEIQESRAITAQVTPSAKPAEAMPQRSLRIAGRASVDGERAAGHRRRTPVRDAPAAGGAAHDRRDEVGAGVDGGHPEEFYAHDLIDSVTTAANAASTTLYPIYARGLSSIGSSLNTRNPNPIYGAYHGGDNEKLLKQGMQPTLADAMMLDQDAFDATRNSLRTMAVGTGGFASTGGDNFDRVFTDIAADLGSYYSIGYRPTATGTKHKLVVRMKNPQWTARAREEVINKSDRDRAVDLVTGALFERTARNDLGISLHFGTKTVDRKKKAHLPLSIRIPIEKLTLVENNAKFDNVADELKLRVAAAVTDVQAATTSVTVQEIDLR